MKPENLFHIPALVRIVSAMNRKKYESMSKIATDTGHSWDHLSRVMHELRDMGFIEEVENYNKRAKSYIISPAFQKVADIIQDYKGVMESLSARQRSVQKRKKRK